MVQDRCKHMVTYPSRTIAVDEALLQNRSGVKIKIAVPLNQPGFSDFHPRIVLSRFCRLPVRTPQIPPVEAVADKQGYSDLGRSNNLIVVIP